MSRRTVYTNRGRTPRNCYTCDGRYACRCDAATIRAAKRGAKQEWDRQIQAEVRSLPSVVDLIARVRDAARSSK